MGLQLNAATAVQSSPEAARAWRPGQTGMLFVFKPGRHHWVTEFLLFFAVSGISMVLGTAIQTFLITQAGVQTTLAFGANIVCALFINYAMRKFVIFKG